MILSGTQISELANQIEAQSSLNNLDMYASAIGANLQALAPGASLKQAAMKLIMELNGQVPPKIDQLLETLRVQGNAQLRATVNELLKPTFYSPTGDAHDAILLGKTAFVAREDLRTQLRNFTNSTPYSTRVLIVRGNEPGGKSYSWEFLRHLGGYIGAYPLRLRLRKTSYTPREFLKQVYRLLRLDAKDLPDLSDNPQLARIDPLITDFTGLLSTLTRRYWLVIDDLNEPGITKPISETAYAMAYAVEDSRPENLWVALLGYNDPIADVELRHASHDDAQFPAPHLVAKFLELASGNGPAKLTPERATDLAKVLFSKYPRLDKEAMMKLTIDLETIGEKLQRGLPL